MLVACEGMGVSRSDSLRSEASSKPRVSFNRDVHVKRISVRGGVTGLAGDSEGRLHPVTLRRETPQTENPRALLRRAESVVCRYSTLPSGRPEGARNGLAPIAESGGQRPSERIMRLIDGQPKKGAEPVAKKKKSSLGQRVKQLFTKKKKQEDDPLKQRYTEYKGPEIPHIALTETDTTDGERDTRRAGETHKSYRSLERRNLRYFGDSETEGSVGTGRRNKQSKEATGMRTHLLRNRRRDSSGEESTSQQSSVVFLHSAAVGDIPGSRRLHSSRRSQSREELPQRSDPHARTLSRSVSVLAPWGPRHRRNEVDYSADQATLGRPPKPPVASRIRNSPEGPPKPRDLLFTGPSFDDRLSGTRTVPASGQGKTRK